MTIYVNNAYQKIKPFAYDALNPFSSKAKEASYITGFVCKVLLGWSLKYSMLTGILTFSGIKIYQYHKENKLYDEIKTAAITASVASFFLFRLSLAYHCIVGAVFGGLAYGGFQYYKYSNNLKLKNQTSLAAELKTKAQEEKDRKFYDNAQVLKSYLSYTKAEITPILNATTGPDLTEKNRIALACKEIGFNFEIFINVWRRNEAEGQYTQRLDVLKQIIDDSKRKYFI